MSWLVAARSVNKTSQDTVKLRQRKPTLWDNAPRLTQPGITLCVKGLRQLDKKRHFLTPSRGSSLGSLTGSSLDREMPLRCPAKGPRTGLRRASQGDGEPGAEPALGKPEHAGTGPWLLIAHLGPNRDSVVRPLSLIALLHSGNSPGKLA